MADFRVEDFDQKGGGGIGFRFALHVVAIVGSIALIAALAVSGYMHASRDLEQIPVIAATPGPVRVQPNDRGGSQVRFLGKSVNRIIEAANANPDAESIVSFAPGPIELGDEEISYRDYEYSQLPVSKISEQIARDIARLTEAGDREDTDLSDYSNTVENRAGLAIVRYYQDQGDRQKVLESKRAPVGEENLAPGTHFALLGDFYDLRLAEREWRRLLGLHFDLLKERDWLVQSTGIGGQRLHRLLVLGLDSRDASGRFCSRMQARSEVCIPAIVRE